MTSLRGTRKVAAVAGAHPAASCLYRPELVDAQQVVDELPGDA